MKYFKKVKQIHEVTQMKDAQSIYILFDESQLFKFFISVNFFENIRKLFFGNIGTLSTNWLKIPT